MVLYLRKRNEENPDRKKGFDEAETLWFGEFKKHPVNVNSFEQVFLVSGTIEGNIWGAFVVERSDVIRIISFRRLNKRERLSMAGKKTKKRLSTEELGEMFDRGEDISTHFEFDKAIQRVNVDFPTWIVKELDTYSTKVGITRTALIKTWIHDRLTAESAHKKHVIGDQ